MNKDIFISISSCNEPELNQTIKSAISNASDPSRLYFGVFLHNLNKDYHSLDELGANIISAQCYYPEKLGTGLPRLMASMLQSQEQRYQLQIDAHTIFENNWDTDLVSAYENLESSVEKPIISTYVPWWYADENGTPKTYDHQVINPYNFSSTSIKNSGLAIERFEKSIHRGIPALRGDWVDWSSGKIYHEHYVTSGHFTFTLSEFFYDLVVDPRLTWAGVEPVLGLRAVSRGYRIFTIEKPILWHKNKWSVDQNGQSKISDDDWRMHKNNKTPLLSQTYWSNHRKTQKRIKDIFLGDYLGYWGAPSMDALKEYEAKVGVNFKDYYDMHKEHVLKIGDTKLFGEMYGEQ